MRALVDANVYISSLLTRNPATPPRIVVRAAISGGYTLLITPGVIDEVRRKTVAKPYLASRITQTEVERLFEILGALAEFVPAIEEPLPEIGRDRKDDYLFAHAVVGRADLLVSGDLGVQGIGRIGDVQIVTPAEFVQILRESGRTPQP